jgi:hypothetical protein
MTHKNLILAGTLLILFAATTAVLGATHTHQFVTADFPGANGSEAFGFADGMTVGVFAFAGPQNQSFTFHHCCPNSRANC